MKKFKKHIMVSAVLLIILVSSIPVFAQKKQVESEKSVKFSSAQFEAEKKYTKSKVPESVKVIGVYAGSIVLDAIGDGLNDNGEKGWGHLCNAASVGLLLISPFVIDYDKSKWGYYLSSYVCLRIATFDYAYNLTRGLPLNYIGSTSTWDKALKKLNPLNTYFGRGVFLTVGIFIPINELKRNQY